MQFCYGKNILIGSVVMQVFDFMVIQLKIIAINAKCSTV